MKTIFKFFIAILLLNSCASVESENENWKNNLGKIEIVKKDYPSLSKFLDEDVKKATTLYENAQKVTDEDQKIDALQKANSTLMTLARQVRSYEANYNGLERTIDELERTLPDSEISIRVDSRIDEAEDEMREANEKLKDKEFSSSQDAQKFFSSYSTAFSDYSSDLQRVINKYEEAQQKELDKNTADTKEVKSSESKTTSTSVKCSYCKKSNDSKSKKCQHCGAPL